MTSTSSGSLRVGGRPEHAAAPPRLVRVGADVDPRDVRAVAVPEVAARASGRPMSAARSSSGASGSGARMPTTVNQRPPSQTWTPGTVDAEARRPPPSRARRRVAGRGVVEEAARRSASRPRVSSRSRSARTPRCRRSRPASMWSVRRTVASTVASEATAWTGPMRRDHLRGGVGQRRVLAEEATAPARRSSRLVPSRSSWRQQVGAARRGDAEHRDHARRCRWRCRARRARRAAGG